MLFKICFPAESETAGFAARELRRYITRMDSAAEIALLRVLGGRPDYRDAILLGWPSEKSEDDGIYIDVEGNSGVIAGTNDRAVLIAAYRYLTELGCRFLRPGAMGEIVPERKLGFDTVRLRQTASYRHRGICIEGAVSYSHVLNMIDWLPKVGMNAYYMQFAVPFAFFDRWYAHKGNEALGQNPITAEEIADISRELVREIKKRGMLYHAVGHGWTCEPFGMEGTSWEEGDYKVPSEAEGLLALVNGKRGLSSGLPLNTNLCYSNPEVLKRMTDAAAEYCKANRDVDYLHFWLADGDNNHCECESCQRKRPSDFYVDYLNELDAKLTAMGLETKIVFLIYVDLLWEPEKSRIKNPGRFVLMFAPITRTYSSELAQSLTDVPVTLSGYERNRLKMPRGVAENVARLKRWQEQFSGDGFIFDYHFMWDHMRDPGGANISRVLFGDMKNLDKLGLNGMISCQLQRAFFPTGLGMYLMARALWDKDADFDTEAAAYLEAAFGPRYNKEVWEYLDKLTALFDPRYLRHETPQADAQAAVRFEEIPGHIAAFEQVISAALQAPELAPAARESWEILGLHAGLCKLLAKALSLKAKGQAGELDAAWEEIAAWAKENEARLSDVFEAYYFLLTMKNTVLGDSTVLF